MTLLAVAGAVDAPEVTAWVASTLGADAEVRRAPGLLLGASPAGEAEPPALVEDDAALLVFSGALAYRADLRRALGEARAAGATTDAALVLAAHRAWGDEAPARIEGEFAYVLAERSSGRLLAVRDHAGTRTLYLAEGTGAGVVVSSLRAAAAFPGVDRSLRPAALLEELAEGAGRVLDETAFRGVRRLPAAHAAARGRDGAMRVEAWWTPPLFEQGGGRFEDAAAELRELLIVSAREHLPAAGRGSVWMSGGYDSTAIFAAACAGGAAPVPVSMSYPVGDRGREDEFILAVARRWGVEVEWVDSRSISPFPEPARWVATLDEPAAHPFERWNLALAAGSAAAGARVALNGNGGDQLFGVSPVFLADLAARGRLGEAWREYRALGGRGLREFAGWAATPWLSRRGRAALGRLLYGEPMRHYLQPRVPAWIRPEALAAAGLEARQFGPDLRRPGETHGSAETAWYFRGAFGPGVLSLVTRIAAAAAVTPRMPLYDRRVIAFAARRPRTDRCQGGEKKRLLRAAMRGLVPEEVLAPRATRTGLPGTYLRRALAEALPRLAEGVASVPRLTELGLVDAARFEASLGRFLADPERHAASGGQLLSALTLEWWLRLHADNG